MASTYECHRNLRVHRPRTLLQEVHQKLSTPGDTTSPVDRERRPIRLANCLSASIWNITKCINIIALHSFPDLEFILFTDASLDATGAVLSQLRNGKEVVIAYASHTFTRPERNWATYDKELYTIVWAVRHFRPYLASSPSIIYTDHKPLVGLRKIPIQNDPTGRRARWASDMDMYQWRIQYCQGKKNGNADAMYRIPGTHMANDEMELPNDDDIVLSVNNLFQIPRVMQHQGNRKHPSTKVLNRVPTNPMLKISCLQGRRHKHTHTHIHAHIQTHISLTAKVTIIIQTKKAEDGASETPHDHRAASHSYMRMTVQGHCRTISPNPVEATTYQQVILCCWDHWRNRLVLLTSCIQLTVSRLWTQMKYKCIG